MFTDKTKWKGVFVVSATPFDADGTFNEADCRKLIDLFIDEGAHGIIVSGSTGEWFALKNEERAKLFEVAADQVRGRVKILGGTCAITTRDAVELTGIAKNIGLDGTLLLPPPYVLPTEREVLNFFEKVAMVDLPVMVYNNPARTQININAAMAEKLCMFDPIVALKDSVKDLHQIAATIDAVGHKLSIFCGLETYALPCLQRGADGIVAMAPNIIGKKAIDLYNRAIEGKWHEAAQIEHIIDRIYQEFYSPGRSAYVVIKEFMNLLGRPGGYPREPLLPLENHERQKLKTVLQELNLM
jgi:4-hydroxy-tetrahydrodipicolinate synthase